MLRYLRLCPLLLTLQQWDDRVKEKEKTFDYEGYS